MRILCCPDKFKGTLTAAEAADAMATGFRRVLPGAIVDCLPLADGGDGTLQAFQHSFGGVCSHIVAPGPQLAPRRLPFLTLPDGSVVLESAQALGLASLRPDAPNPLVLTSRGLGVQIQHALSMGARKICIGLGGTLTVDGGAGLLQALGFSLLDAHAQPIGPGGMGLKTLAKLEFPPVLPDARLQILLDVQAPLTGPEGAAQLYAPQKGADPEAVALLEAALLGFQRLLLQAAGRHFGEMPEPDVPGDGAAGGLGFALRVGFQAQGLSGAEAILDAVDFDTRVQQADLVVSGEGMLDRQTWQGKVVQRVFQRTRHAGRPFLAIVGRCLEPLPPFPVYACSADAAPLPDATVARERLIQTAAAVAGSLIPR